ncbi:holo-ACP synthase, partial [Staphylococcus epidermidis]|nr:holo-ACP synthase [Staphylococcus epidermidis]
MIYGIGIDLIEIERIKNLQNQTKFIERILTIEER